MISGKFGRFNLSGSQTQGETSTDDNIDENVVNAAEGRHHAFVNLIIVYGVLIAMLSIVLPLSLFLQGEASYKDEGKFLSAFHYYVYLTAILAIVYIAIIAYKKEKEGKKETLVNFGQSRIKEGQGAPAIYESHEGVSFLLRMGLVVFASGGCLLEGFRIMQYAEEDSEFVWHCFGPNYLALGFFRFVFYIVQSYILFKYHKIILNFHHLFIRLCLAHLLATNITTWSLTVILEAVESYRHALVSTGGKHKRAAGPHPGPLNHTRSTEISCQQYPDTLSTVAAPYIFPFLIEYSLLAAAILYNMFVKVGHDEYKEVKEWVEEKRGEETRRRIQRQPVALPNTGSQCDKAHTGLFVGIIVFCVVAIASCFFLFFKSNDGVGGTATGAIHIGSDIIVNLIAGIAIIPGFIKMKQLHFTGTLVHGLDQNLLVLALFGYYVLLSFMAIASLYQVNHQGPYGFWAKVIGAMCIIDMVQITMQVSFIGDGLRRKAISQENADTKPGRSFLTFLVICNFGLWLVNTFMLKESYAFEIFSGFYGDLAWIIILNSTLPLAIYYRFHASVCLSEIWLHAYKKVSLQKIIRGDLDSCGKIL